MDVEKEHVQILMDTDSPALGQGQALGVLHANIPIRSISSKGLF
jgi:cell division topological specificity factor